MTPESIYNLLVRKGIDATIRTYPDAEFNPDTNKTVLGNPIDYTVKIVPPYKYIKEEYRTTQLVTWGKGLTGIANYNLSFVVEVGLVIIINSKKWTVVSVTPIQDNTGILFYSLGIEAGD